MSRSVAEHIRFVEPTEVHVDRIAARARQADIDEIWAAGHMTVAQAMLSGIKYSTMSYTVLFYDKPVCMVGVVPASLLGSRGVPWMIGTPDLERYQFAFLSRNKEHVEYMLRQYETLENYVDERNVLAQRWLRWLGFTLAAEPVPYGKDGLPFRRFVMVRQKKGEPSCAVPQQQPL